MSYENSIAFLGPAGTYCNEAALRFAARLGIDDPDLVASLVKRIATNYRIPYFTLTPSFSICPVHGYIPGEHFECPLEAEHKEAVNE